MGIAHEGWWTELGLGPGASGPKSHDKRYWEARLGPLRQYPPVAFQDPATGHTISLTELVAMIRARQGELEADRGWL